MRTIIISLIILIINHASFAADVSQFDVKKIKLGASITEVKKIFGTKKYYENFYGEDNRGVYYMRLYTQDKERFTMFFSQDSLGKKLYYISYQTNYFDNLKYAAERFSEMQSQLRTKYGEPTDIQKFAPEEQKLSYCWGDCDKVKGIDKEGQSLTASTLGKLLTLRLEDHSLEKEVLNVAIRIRKKELDDFLSHINKYALGLSLDRAKKIFMDKYKRLPTYKDHRGGPQIYEYDNNSFKFSFNISFTGNESKSQLDNKIYQIDSEFRVDESQSAIINREDILNNFVRVYGTPTDLIKNENQLQACWGVCLKTGIGSFYSNSSKSQESEAFSEGRRIILDIRKISVSFEQYDFALAYQYGKAKSELREKGIKNKTNL